jgi:hypothetical protein
LLIGEVRVLEQELRRQKFIGANWAEQRFIEARAGRRKGSLEQELGIAKVYWSKKSAEERFSGARGGAKVHGSKTF